MSYMVPHGRLPIIVLVATALHLVWGVGLALDPASHFATAVHSLYLATGSFLIAIIALITAALLAITGVIWPWNVIRLKPRMWQCLMMLPQQCILIISSTGAIRAMAALHFADGVIRPFWFIVADQIPIVLITVGYMIALGYMATEATRD